MVDPAPMQRRVPVGFRFCPTEEELVAYYLRHKLMALHPSIYNTIPEIDVCEFEPWDILAWAVSALPESEPDDSECYFFSRRDYKYSNSTRWNRTTPLGFWKVTGKDRPIKDRDTNKVIGIKKNLVFYEGRVPHEIRRNWVIHEYHDAMLPPEQRTYVICKLMKKYEKKAEEKTINFEHDQLIDDERESNNHTNFEYENQANFCMTSEEHYLPNMNVMTQTSLQPMEAINSSMIQAQYLLDEDIESMIKSLSQSNEETTPPELNSIMGLPRGCGYGYGYEESYYN